MFRTATTALVILSAGLCLVPRPAAQAQEPKRPAGSIQLSFLPPPLEKATYSLGIFDAKTNKLVRHLQEVALEKDFTIGLNGLITNWDGKDDNGKPVPPGRYAARGYAVGSFKVEGLNGFGNDFAGDDGALRIKEVASIAFVPEDGGLVVCGSTPGLDWQVARYGGGEKTSLQWQRTAPGVPTLAGGPAPKCSLAVEADTVTVDEVTPEGSARHTYKLADGKDAALAEGKPDAADHCEGKDGTVWKIEDGVLSQYSAQGERLRRLPWKEGEPVPFAVTASKTADRLYLLENSKEVQRVRGLSWKETTKEGDNVISTWTTFFENEIRHFPPTELRSLADIPTSSSLEVPLAENPLSPGKPQRLKLAVAGGPLRVDGSLGTGGYLATADGLRLRQISQRPGIVMGQLAKGKTADGLLFFQYDGADWDEFSVKGLKTIMEFDAGEFEMTATGEKPADPKTVEPPDL